MAAKTKTTIWTADQTKLSATFFQQTDGSLGCTVNMTMTDGNGNTTSDSFTFGPQAWSPALAASLITELIAIRDYAFAQKGFA